MKPHDPTSTPSPSARHPEAVRATLLNRRHVERAGFLFAELREGLPLYVENVDEDRKYLISERQMIVLLQFLAGDLLKKQGTTRPIDLPSWLAGFLEQSQPGWRMGQSSPWNFRLLSAIPKDQAYREAVRPVSQSPKHLDLSEGLSTSQNISQESSSHVGCKHMMDVAGGRGNAPASIAGERG